MPVGLDAFSLSGETALITGGGRGIGRAIALELARRGADVLINYVRHADAAQAVATEVRDATGQQAETLRANVADQPSVQKMFANVVETISPRSFSITASSKSRLCASSHERTWSR